MIVLIDNYDSFTFNLFHYLGGLGADVVVHRNDKITTDQVIAMEPEAIVLSPGPCTPNDAGICLDLISLAAPRIPILGVCLGHQAIGQAFGGEVVRAPVQVHGKLSEIRHQGESDALPFARRRAQQLAGRSDGDGRDPGPHDHGACPSHACGARGPVPSGKHRLRAWSSHLAQFPQHRFGLECRKRPIPDRRAGRPPRAMSSRRDR
jgi:GMP synthase-like glutamine amidotransferase